MLLKEHILWLVPVSLAVNYSAHTKRFAPALIVPVLGLASLPSQLPAPPSASEYRTPTCWHAMLPAVEPACKLQVVGHTHFVSISKWNVVSELWDFSDVEPAKHLYQ